MATQAPQLDPIAIVEALDTQTITNRLLQMEKEREALIILLRARRRLGNRGTKAEKPKEGGNDAA